MRTRIVETRSVTEAKAVQSPIALRALVLAVLASGSEMYGLQIINEVERRTGGCLLVEGGSLYPLLHALEREGHVAARKDKPRKTGGRPRIYHQITRSGKELHDVHRSIVDSIFC